MRMLIIGIVLGVALGIAALGTLAMAADSPPEQLGDYNIIYGYDSETQAWQRYVPDRPELTTLTTLEHGAGYIARNDQGWNLVGYCAPTSTPTPTPDPCYTACLVDEADLGFTTDWALENVAQWWGVAGTEDCENPDVRIVVRDFGVEDRGYGGLYWEFPDEPLIELNSYYFAAAWAAGGAQILLHEWGHFAGLGHLEEPSAMYYVARYLPTDADRALVADFCSRWKR